MYNYEFKLVKIERKCETTHQQEQWKEEGYSCPTDICIGRSLEIPMERGGCLRTSRLVSFNLHGEYMVVETGNSKYTFQKK